MSENIPINTNSSQGGRELAQQGKKRKAEALPDDKTVEEYLEEECKKLADDVTGYAESLIETLRSEYKKRKEAFLFEARGSKGPKQAKLGRVEVVLTVSQGDYEGSTFNLSLEPGKVALVGRSKKKPFTKKEGGVSLVRDCEVSTEHGRFAVDSKAGNGLAVTYEDLGSTNGSFRNDSALDANTPEFLFEGDSLRIGTNIINVKSIVEL